MSDKLVNSHVMHAVGKSQMEEEVFG